MSAKLLMTQRQVEEDPSRWHDLRRGGVTASETAKIMGLAPDSYGGAYAVFAAKMVGREIGDYSDEMMRGTHLEPYIADRFAAEHPQIVINNGGLYVSAERPWQLATPDRMGYRLGTVNDFPVQIKTSVSRWDNRGKLLWGEPGTDDIPVWYRVQCLTEMDVTEADEVLVPCLFMQTWDLLTYRIVRDAAAERDIARIREAGAEFMGRLERREAPPVDWTPSAAQALKALNPVAADDDARISAATARKYRAARQAHARAVRRLGLAANQVLFEMGDAKYGVAMIGGEEVKVATRSQFKQKRTDTKRLRTEYPEIAKAVEREIPIDSLRPGSWAQVEGDDSDRDSE